MTAAMKPGQAFGKILANIHHDLARAKNYLPAKRLGPGRNVVLSGGKLRPPYSCSVNVVDHCNLNCRNCNQAAPALSERYADPEAVLKSLRNLAKVYRPRSVYVQGGEFLLHPDVPAVLKAVRASEICRHITILTNATLLDKASAELWQMANAVEISAYPGRPISDAAWAVISRQAKTHYVQLKSYLYSEFRTTFATRGTNLPELTQKIFDCCEMAHLWGCHTIVDGYFFKCPQSIYIPRIPGSPATYDFREDGIELTENGNLLEKLRRYLEDRNPLKSCAYCLGTVGRLRPHELADRSSWLFNHEGTNEEMIDFNRLEQLEKGPSKFRENRARLV